MTDDAAPPSRRALLFRIALTALLPIAFALQRVAAQFPDTVESLYAQGAYPFVQRLLAGSLGWLPFSAAESALALLVVLSVVHVVKGARAVRRGGIRWQRQLGRSALNTGAWTGALYAAFVLTWGLNYARTPLAERIGLDVRARPVGELAALADDLVERVNALRAGLPEDADGVFVFEGGTEAAFGDVPQALDAVATRAGLLSDGRVVLRAPFVSPIQSMVGVSGVYSPFTAESHVNGDIPHVSLLFVACHEAAHARGIAAEDEANFVAALACRGAPSRAFRYSGAASSLGYVLRALGRIDADRAREIAARRSDAVQRDRDASVRFWRERRTRIDIPVNDLFLRTQGIEDGKRSYGRVVDLLLAERASHLTSR